MISSIEKIRLRYKKDAHFKKRLEELYRAMDSKYKAAADFYEFACTGCEDNCCFTRFYHHTFVEYFYILDGFEALEHEKSMEVKKRAGEVCKKSNAADEKGTPVRLLCPLNIDSLCSLYQYRPMICRLHGVPHELNTPERGISRTPGCGYFMKQHKDKDYFSFDRSSLYLEMAKLERDFRQKAGALDKVKLTVAEMLSAYYF
ncbi:MAG: hypothetical protein JRI53_08630 [Deltaproteobacteria bacterium]|nr:hypothetical protein [Deltaproteobacteria bacterium]